MKHIQKVTKPAAADDETVNQIVDLFCEITGACSDDKCKGDNTVNIGGSCFRL